MSGETTDAREPGVRPRARERVRSEWLRWAYVALAVAVPLLFIVIARTRDAELRRLRTEGIRTEATPTRIIYANGKQFVDFEFTSPSGRHAGQVDRDRVGGIEDLPFPIIYLPEDPLVHWVGPQITDEHIASELKVERSAVPITFLVFMAMFVEAEVRVRRRRRLGHVPQPSLRGRAIFFALLFYVVLIASTVDAKSRGVFERAFGERPLSLPIAVFAPLLLTVLYIPAISSIRHWLILMDQGRRDGAIQGTLSSLIYLGRVGRLHPHLRVSQSMAVLGLFYFCGMCALWIAYTAWLGI